MKFISVFVLYIYVRTAYSYYIESTPQYTEPALPGNVQNAYTNPQQTVNNPPVPIQQEYKIGPEIPFPIQIAKTDPAIENEYQKGQQYSGDPRYLPTVHHVASNLQNLYQTSVPKKRYTIVHPNGTIEHTDEIGQVTAKYNNYLMVKATDILAHFNQLKEQPNYYNKPIKTTNQNGGWTPTTTYNNGLESQASNEKPIDQIYSNQNIQESKVVSSNSALSNPAVIQSAELINAQNIQEVNNSPVTSIKNILEENSSINQDSFSNVVAANPLPVYPTTPVRDIVEDKEQLSESLPTKEYYTVTPSVGDAVSITDLNSKDSSTSIIPTIKDQLPAEISERDALQVFVPKSLEQSMTQETQTPTTIPDTEQSQDTPEITTIEEPIIQQKVNIPEASKETESSESVIVLTPNTILDVSQPNDSLDDLTGTTVTTTINDVPEEPSNVSKESNTLGVSEQQKVSIPEASKETESSESATILTPNTILDVSQSNDSLDEQTGTTVTTTINNVPEEPSNVSKESNTLGVSDQLLTSSGNRPPLTWFTLSEDRVWDAIRSDANNVYFFFLPSKPKRLKEIKKTIYPNGTIVEEIIERDN